MKFSEIVQKIDAAASNSLLSNPECDPEITGVAAIADASLGTLSYIEGAKYASFVGKTAASAVILPRNESLQTEASARGIAWICVADPRLGFARAIALFYKPYHPTPEIHPRAVIHPSAVVGKNVYIGAHAVIEAGVKIGDEVCIHPNVVIYPDGEIGDRAILHANCTIHERTKIGADCVIHSGAVIGAEGFGFVPTKEGWFKMEQSGCVVLEDGVEVGCNSTIDRPAVGETRIGSNTKLDNVVHIGHGCTVGSNCAFAAQVGLAGAVKIGNNVLLAGQVGITNQAEVGNGVIATGRAGIHSDIEPGIIVGGYPAVPQKLFLKICALYSRIPEMYQSIKQIQRQLDGGNK